MFLLKLVVKHVHYPVKEVVKVPVHIKQPYPVEKHVHYPVHVPGLFFSLEFFLWINFTEFLLIFSNE